MRRDRPDGIPARRSGADTLAPRGLAGHVAIHRRLPGRERRRLVGAAVREILALRRSAAGAGEAETCRLPPR